ncbi:deoxycytidylate deaminase [Brucella anthropi]|uniref:deoxycytidylate deaminase n=1 Tax=Brucella anthropi TaxID=529 RepID=UPI00398816C2
MLPLLLDSEFALKSKRWDEYGLKEAQLSATMSKDTDRQVGACILRPDGTIASKGWNGFPRRCDDDPEIYKDRRRKLLRVVHAEANAIISAAQSLTGCTLYVSPLHPCATCAGLIIQSGIIRVVTDHISDSPRWKEAFDEARLMFGEAGVIVDIIGS